MKILIITKELPYPANTVRKIRIYDYIKKNIPGNQVTILSRYDRSYDNSPATDHFVDMGATPVFCNEAVHTTGLVQKIKNLFLSVFSPLPYSVYACISERMRERFLKVYEQGKFDKIICDGIHQTIHIPQTMFSYKVLLEQEISTSTTQQILKKTPNPVKKLFILLEWKKFRKMEDETWKNYDEIHVCSEENKKIIEERVEHKRVTVITCD